MDAALVGQDRRHPGAQNINYLCSTAIQPGIYRGLCAEFCGEEHAVMRFRVVAVPQDVFDSWTQQHQQPVGPAIAAGTTDPARLGPGDPARGENCF